MTGWRCKRFIVTLATDLHCGARPLGFVARTLPFVPAHLPWYAVAAQLPRLLGWEGQFDSYQKVISRLEPVLRFSPFFPLAANDKPLLPWGEDMDSIEADLLGSRSRAALNYGTRGALENRLFEIETLLARSRSGKPTRLLGCCFWRPMEDELTMTEAGELIGAMGGDRRKHPLVDLLRNSQWGGQRNQGMGAIAEVEEAKTDDAADAESNPFFQRLEEGAAEFPRLALAKEQRGLFYLRYQDGSEKHIMGRLMPLAGRRHSRQESGLAAESAVVVWDIGWRLRDAAAAGNITIDLEDRRYASLGENAFGEENPLDANNLIEELP